MIVVFAGVFASLHGEPALVFAAVVLAGVLQIAFGEGTPAAITPEETKLLESSDNKVMLFEFSGPLSFGAAADLGHHVRERMPRDARAMVLDFSRVSFIDV